MTEEAAAAKLSPARTQEIIARFADRHVLVAGDFFLDEYVYARVSGVSPEMPVLRLCEEHREYRAGAAGNLAANFASLGARVSAFGVIGDDESGSILVRQLKSAGVETDGLIADGTRRTPTLTRILDQPTSVHAARMPRHHLRLDRENQAPVSDSTLRRLAGSLADRLSGAESLFLSDYDEHPARTGVLAPFFIRRVLDDARRAGVLCCGTSRHHPEDLQGLDYLLSNEVEAGRLGLKSRENLEAFAQDTLRRMQMRGLCITLGKDGAFCYSDGRAFRASAPVAEVVDPCGAGDTFAAAFVLSLLSGASVTDAVGLGVQAGSLAVGKPGTEPVKAAELTHESRYAGRGGRKLVEREELVEILERIRPHRKIVFTNGYFDLFHSGHVQLLTRAREFGDILVVGINSDRSTAANKGAGRPVLSETHRIEILAALECVDYIVVFDELTPINLLRRLRPDVLVKGGNYSPEQVVGKDIVESAGGAVRVVGYFGDLTTTGLIRSVKSASDGTRSS